MGDGSTPRIDISLSVFLIFVCGLVLWETRKIPPGTFDPLGSAPLPQAVSILIIIFCLVLIVRAGLKLRQGVGAPPDLGFALRPWDAAGVFALTIVYVVVLAFRLTSFGIASTVFLCLTIGFLTRFRPRLLPAILLVSLIMSFGSQFAFTRIFFVDLPTG